LNGWQAETKRVARFRCNLLNWFQTHHRKLPWRSCGQNPANPYHVLVSEFMLQQTQVATVIEYFNRFIKTLPTIESLASAKEQQVLQLWQGLGYYRRALHLHAAARMIIDHFGGQVPQTLKNLSQLPGVGTYTAGAIASIAYDEKVAAIDGNVSRVISRLLAIDKPIDDGPTRRELQSIAEKFVSPRHPGIFNQALMELGALVCLPRRPRCSVCPVRQSCQAYLQGCVNRLPVRHPRRRPRSVTHHIFAIEKHNCHLVVQRPDKGMWSRLWQMPTAENLEAQKPSARSRQWIEHELGLVVETPRRIGTFNHQTTHRSIHFVLWHTTVISGRLRRGVGQWRRLGEINDLAMANPQHTAVGLITCHTSHADHQPINKRS